jgi:hypothetical protein
MAKHKHSLTWPQGTFMDTVHVAHVPKHINKNLTHVAAVKTLTTYAH